MVLKIEVVEEVKRLVSGGISYRDAAKAAGVSRGIVTAIALGRGRYAPGGMYDQSVEGSVNGCPTKLFNSIAIDQSKVDRCGTCGCKVEMPCRACELRGGCG